MDRIAESIRAQGYQRRPVRGRRQNRLLRPWEFDLIHDVYSAIIKEPWFPKDAVDRSQFAAECLETYQTGVTDPAEFHAACERQARKRHAMPDARLD